MKKRLFTDLDGVLARYHDEPMYLQRMYEKGFFISLRPFLSVVEAIRLLSANENVEVFILSSCISDVCKEEKRTWIREWLPEIPAENYILVDVGANKAECLGYDISDNDVLLDDYNKNLEEWQLAGGHAIKLVNNINHKGKIGPLWTGECIFERDHHLLIAEELKTMIGI